MFKRYEEKVLNCDGGNTAFYRNDQEFEWILNDDDRMIRICCR